MTNLKLSQAQLELARDILTNAVETGAISYWTTNLDWRRDDEDHMIIRIRFEVLDEDTQKPVEPRVVYHIDEAQIIRAMKAIVVADNINPELHRRITGMWAADDYLAGQGGDSESDDVIVQFAALKRLTFG